MNIHLTQLQPLLDPTQIIDSEKKLLDIRARYRQQLLNEFNERLLDYLIIDSEEEFSESFNIRLSAQALILNSNDVKELKTILMSLIRKANLSQNDPLYLQIKNLLS